MTYYQNQNQNQNQNQINQEILNFNENLRIYQNMYNTIVNKTEAISPADETYLLNLKQELLDSANYIISNIDMQINENQSANMNANMNQSQLIQQRMDIYELWDRISNNDFQEQVSINNSLVGSLEDTNLKYTSSYYVYLTNILLAITVVSILLHFFLNRNTSTFGSAILLIICILAIYYGAKYFGVF